MQMSTTISNLAFGFVLTVTTCHAQAQQRCGSENPERFAHEFFGRLEAARSPADFKMIYDRELSSRMRSQVSESQFAREFSQIKKELGIEGRSFEQRITRPPTLEFRPSSTPTTTVIAQTSSPRGKVEQRVVLECERGEWKANGVWYSPARF